jgi:hypothetical protein
MANLKNNTTFNKSTQKGIAGGFYSRVLFSTSYNSDDQINLMGYTDWYSTVNYDGIQDLIDLDFTTVGSHILPPKYWVPGKTIRISGNGWAYAAEENILNPPKYLNMRFGLQGNSVTTWLAIQNDGFNHIFVDPNTSFSTLGTLPLYFEATIICQQRDLAEDPPMYFTATGHIQYDRANWDTIGNNTGRSYVPLEILGGGIGVSDTNYYTPSTTVMFNLYGSTIDTFSIQSLLIEELA